MLVELARYPAEDAQDLYRGARSVDWSDWLTSAGSASVASAVITADSGVTLEGSPQIASGVVTQVISGGEAGFGGGGIHGKRALEGTFLGGCIFTGRVAAASILTGRGADER